LITADGGFDFSTDFNNQEENFVRLFLSELYTAALIQKAGGSFIVKVFDMFTIETNILVSILNKLYEKVFVVKPFTSRPANSERYLVCLKYVHGPKNLTLLNDCKNELVNQCGIEKSLSKYLIPDVVRKLCVYNTYYAGRQIYYLQETLNEAKMKQIDRYRSDHYLETEQKCKDWCDHYELDHVL
jgi:hypothetical protein